MSYLRFTRDDYRALCRLCSPHRTHALRLPAFRRLLLTSLSTARPALAERLRDLFPPLARKVARLSDDQFEWLYAQVTGQAGGGD